MCAVVDNQLSALAGILAAQVGHALLSDDDLYRMLAVVHVRRQRHDRADLAAFGGGRTGEDRQIGVASEVPRTADSIHHRLAHYMGRIDVPAEIHFDRRIHGDDAQPADYLRMVRDLLGSYQNSVL